MAEQSPKPKPFEIHSLPPRSASGGGGSRRETPDVHSTAAKLERAKEVYRAYEGHGERPTIVEILGWGFYELCSLFVVTVLIPVVFPLIISQISGASTAAPPQGWCKSYMGFDRSPREMKL